MRRITQVQLERLAACFDAVTARLLSFEERSDPDFGGSVEAGDLELGCPVLNSNIEMLGVYFQLFLTNWTAGTRHLKRSGSTAAALIALLFVADGSLRAQDSRITAVQEREAREAHVAERIEYQLTRATVALATTPAASLPRMTVRPSAGLWSA